MLNIKVVSFLIKFPILKRLLPSFIRNLFILINKENFKIIFKDLLLETNIRDPHDRKIFLTNQYEEDQFKEVINLINKYQVKIFLDVGVNSGIYSLILAKKFDDLIIDAFEPIELTYNKLLRNIKNNKFNKRINTYNLGLSNKRGFLNMKTNVKFGYNQSSGYKVANYGQHTAKFVRGDEILNYKNNTIFIKIDTEGHELFVLDGLKQLINNNNILLQIEIWDKNFTKVENKLKIFKFTYLKNIEKDYYFYKFI